MSAFSKLWDTEVKALAKACVTEPRLIELMTKGDSYKPTQEEKTYLDEVSKKYLDLYGMYYISDLIWRIEHALADGREWQAGIAIANVYSTLADESYFQNVFNGDEANEEWKTRKALRDGLKKLMSVA